MVDAINARTSSANRSLRPYLVALVVAVLLNLGLRLRILEHVLQSQNRAPSLLIDFQRGLFVVFVALQGAFWLFLLGRVLPKLRRDLVPSRRQLGCLVQLATGMAAANLLSESLAIYRLNLSSYGLLMDSLLLYLGVSMIFLFWYWYGDNPHRFSGRLWEQAAAASQSLPYGIVFPEETLELSILQTAEWRPGFIDYAYFTILSSNCFSPPEGHLLVGRPIKVLHTLHSLAMIIVFIVILARAINTLG